MPTEEEIREVFALVTLAQNSQQFKAALTKLTIVQREHIIDAANRGIHCLLNKAQSRRQRLGGMARSPVKHGTD